MELKLELELELIGVFDVKVRAGVEMALIDAAANSVRIPLWRLFGGKSNSITTDITVQYRCYSNLLYFFSKFIDRTHSIL